MRKSAPDPGLQQIADLERKIVLGKLELWTFNGVSDEEIARLRPGLEQEAKNAGDRLRSDYLARRQS